MMDARHSMSAGLAPGKWVKRGLTRVYVVDNPDLKEDLWATIGDNLADDDFIDLTPVTGELCDDCGRLLAPDEKCPACLVWATLDAVRASWRPIPYVPKRIEEVAA